MGQARVNGNPPDSSRKPNFLLIVADDLGFSDLGCYGAEIKTPHIDRLAAEGVRFSDYHSAAACSPTRAMLMSGTDNHIAGVGVMYEHKPIDPSRWDVPGHEGYLNLDVAALPEVLGEAGYHNMISGKWHLGYKDEYLPAARGFHKSYSLLPGCSNHYGWEPQLEGDDLGFPRPMGHVPLLYIEDGKKVLPTPNIGNTEQSGFYSSSFYAENLIKYLENRPTDHNGEAKPFFGYLAFPAPHWPLQCPSSDRDLYKGRYDAGPDVLRQARLRALVELGLIPKDVVPHEVVFPTGASKTEWEEMTAEERRMSARAMEVYAGMVTALDRAVGRVIEYLRASGELDNTVVMFMSDNGAEGAALEALPIMGPKILNTIDKYYDNSYENLGNHNSFCWIGPRWAQASTAPNRLFKSHVTEGGIRVPLVIRYPPFKSFQPGSISHAFTTCMDVMPTFLSLAGVSHPNPTPAHPRDRAPFQGRQVFSMRGKSLVPHLQSGAERVYEEGEDEVPVGWEFLGRASVRRGRWKAVYMPLGQPTGTGAWQLYDLAADQGETRDLAKELPEQLKELLESFAKWQQETGAVFGPPITKPITQGYAAAYTPYQLEIDPVEDQKAWMTVGVGKRFIDTERGRQISRTGIKVQ